MRALGSASCIIHRDERWFGCKIHTANPTLQLGGLCEIRLEISQSYYSLNTHRGISVFWSWKW